MAYCVRELLPSASPRPEAPVALPCSAPGPLWRAADDRGGAGDRTAPDVPPAPRKRPPKWRIVLVDDHEIVRRGLAELLNDEPDLEVVGEGRDGLEALAVVRRARPDVVLMDVTMPRMNGIEATRRLVAEFPGLAVIGLSMFDDIEKEDLMRRAGAVAYIAKGGPPDALIAAIRACCA